MRHESYTAIGGKYKAQSCLALLQVAEQAGEVADDVKKFSQYKYPNMTRTQVNSRDSIPALVA